MTELARLAGFGNAGRGWARRHTLQVIEARGRVEWWSYTVSHGQLLLRHPKAPSHPRRLDILFKDVVEAHVLNPGHPKGTDKARVFAHHGFNRDNADALVEQVRRGILENAPVPGMVDRYGARFTVDISVKTPGGAFVLRTGWIYESGSDVPRLVTLFIK